MPGSTKGQMQIAEVVVVLIIFFLIVGIGMVFFVQFIGDQAEVELTYVDSLNLAERAKFLSSLPELHCSLRGDEDFTCIDVYRLDAFIRQLTSSDANRRHYANTLAGYRAKITCIYPTDCSQRFEDVEIFDFTRPDAQDSTPFVLPVVLHNPVTGSYAYAELELVQT